MKGNGQSVIRVSAFALLFAASASASISQTTEVTPENPERLDQEQPSPANSEQKPAEPASNPAKVTLSGYVETFYSYNFNNPSNRITNFRGFDNRANTFMISNAVLSATGEKGPVSGKITAQVGNTPDTYYLAEPSGAGTPSTPPSSATTTWKYIQEAWAGYRAPIGTGLLFQAGIFLSPIGPEVMPVKDNWNWSRSNLFFGLPFYHAGVRATYAFSPAWTVEFMVCNGWNDILDNNKEKSIELSATYAASKTLNLHFLYFGGVERPTGAPEGRPWRHLFDAYATWDATPAVSVLLHADAGFENNVFGTSDWAAVAGYSRVKLATSIFLAVRVDVFWEHAAANTSGAANTIFWPASRVGSETVTFDYRPLAAISIRLEWRHDGASAPMFFDETVAGDGSVAFPYIPNAKSQSTATLGVTAWF
jgi:Putative beta-barrel porin-2, OmpL-like. bbp2